MVLSISGEKEETWDTFQRSMARMVLKFDLVHARGRYSPCHELHAGFNMFDSIFSESRGYQESYESLMDCLELLFRVLYIL